MKRYYPEAYQKDLKTEFGDITKLGTYTSWTGLSIHKDKPITVINAYAQFGWGTDTRRTAYSALKKALIKVNEDFPKGSIGMPKIGCGLAGGDWKIVSDIIEIAFPNREITIYEPAKYRKYMRKNMKIAIVGGREFTNKKLFNKVLDKLLQRDIFKNISEIVSGGAKGIDTLAEEYAEDNNILTNIILPEWDRYGRSAGFIRNHKIMKNSDIGIAFWDGESKGTGHSVKLFPRFKKQLVIVKYNKKTLKIEKIYFAGE